MFTIKHKIRLNLIVYIGIYNKSAACRVYLGKDTSVLSKNQLLIALCFKQLVDARDYKRAANHHFSESSFDSHSNKIVQKY